MKKLRLLVLDGGGTRGIIMARILEEIELYTKKKVSELFDLIAGTSTGGILALALMSDKTAKECVDLYKDLSAQIFAKKYVMNPFFDKAMYDPKLLELFLKNYFGNKKLSTDTSSEGKPKVFVVTKKDSNPSPHLLRNYTIPHDTGFLQIDGEIDWEFHLASRATSAAPLYFPPLEHKGSGFTDGGVGYNNPGIIACEEVCALYNRTLRDSVELVLSLGCGVEDKSLTKDFSLHPLHLMKSALGRLYSQTNLHVQSFIQVLASTEMVHRQLKNISNIEKFAYFRFNPSLPLGQLELDLATPEYLQQLLNFTEQWLHENREKFEELCKLLNTQ